MSGFSQISELLHSGALEKQARNYLIRSPHRYRIYRTGVQYVRETRNSGARLRATASGSGTLMELQRFVADISHRGLGVHMQKWGSYFHWIGIRYPLNQAPKEHTYRNLQRTDIPGVQNTCMAMLATYPNTEYRYLPCMVLLATYWYTEVLLATEDTGKNDREKHNPRGKVGGKWMYISSRQPNSHSIPLIITRCTYRWFCSVSYVSGLSGMVVRNNTRRKWLNSISVQVSEFSYNGA